METQALAAPSGKPVVTYDSTAGTPARIPDERRPSHAYPHGNSATLTAGIIVADVVGAGILSMAVAVSLLGWLLGSVALVLLLAMNVHISIMLWRAKMRHPHARTFMELAESVFADGPDWQRRAVGNFVSVAQLVFIFLCMGLYILSVGKGFGKLFYDTHWCLRVWTMLGCLVILPICASAKRMGEWRCLIWVNVLTIAGSILLPLGYLVSSGLQDSRVHDGGVYPVEPALNFSGVLMALSIFAFAFTGQFILVEVMCEMQDITEFPKAYIWLSAPFQLFGFALVGVGGYYFLGNKVHGIITDSISFGPTFRLAAICLLCHMVITYLIKSIVFCQWVHRWVDGPRSDDNSPRMWAIWCCIVTVTLAAAWLTAQIVPFFTDLVDLLGASLTPLSCWVMPIVLYVRSQSGPGGKSYNFLSPEGMLLLLEIALSLVITIGGTYFSVAKIFNSWETYGYPFSCHCEGLWQTCECSGNYPGMADQCPATPTGFFSLPRSWSIAQI